MTAHAAGRRPLAVRVLRAAGVAAAGVGVIAFAVGAILGFDELARIWAVIAGFLLAIGATAFAGARPSRLGLVSGLVACLLMLLFPPVGTLVTVAIALIASQSWPQLRDYYGLRRRIA